MKSYLGLGGLIGRIVNFWIRDIHPSQYGCICPIDTPKGINIGLIGSLAIHVRIGHWGFLEIPFYESFEGGKKNLLVEEDLLGIRHEAKEIGKKNDLSCIILYNIECYQYIDQMIQCKQKFLNS